MRARSCLGGKDVVGLPPHKRDVNTVFQSYALFPHLTIHENVAFGLRRKGDQGLRAAGPRRGDPASRRSRGLRGAQAAPALRGTAAAGRARAGARQRAAGAAPRRAARRSRPEAAQAAPARAEGTPARPGDHVRARHARPGGGDDDGRHDRGHERGPGRAAGRACRALRQAAHGVRRRLPRRFEPAPWHCHRARSRPDRDGRGTECPARRPHRRRRHRRSAGEVSPRPATGGREHAVRHGQGDRLHRCLNAVHRHDRGRRHRRLRPEPRRRPAASARVRGASSAGAPNRRSSSTPLEQKETAA